MVAANDTANPEAQERTAIYQRLLAEGALKLVEGCSDHLQSHVASRLVNACLQQEDRTVEQILLNAVDYGHPSEEAQGCLGKMGHKAGLDTGSVEAHFEQIQWDSGVGRMRLVFDHPLWHELPALDVLDLQDKLALDEELGFLLGPEQPLEEESRQCLCLHVARAFSEGHTALQKLFSFAKSCGSRAARPLSTWVKQLLTSAPQKHL